MTFEFHSSDPPLPHNPPKYSSDPPTLLLRGPSPTLQPLPNPWMTRDPTSASHLGSPCFSKLLTLPARALSLPFLILLLCWDPSVCTHPNSALTSDPLPVTSAPSSAWPPPHLPHPVTSPLSELVYWLLSSTVQSTCWRCFLKGS